MGIHLQLVFRRKYEDGTSDGGSMTFKQSETHTQTQQ